MPYARNSLAPLTSLQSLEGVFRVVFITAQGLSLRQPKNLKRPENGLKSYSFSLKCPLLLHYRGYVRVCSFEKPCAWFFNGFSIQPYKSML
jgi:hypothetical protein